MANAGSHVQSTASWNGGVERARTALYKKYQAWIRGHDGAFLYEKIIQQLYSVILEPGDACIDVGANKGFHSFPMAAAVGSTGKVYAFEPIGELNAALVDRARRDNIRQIEFIVAALGSRAGVAEFFNIKNYTPLSGLKLRSPPSDAVIEKNPGVADAPGRSHPRGGTHSLHQDRRRGRRT